MAAHSSVLAWRIPWTEEPGWTVHGATKESDMTEGRKHKEGIVGFAAAAKSLQSCLTLCDPVPGILQARTLEWLAISFSNA